VMHLVRPYIPTVTIARQRRVKIAAPTARALDLPAASKTDPTSKLRDYWNLALQAPSKWAKGAK
jgi:hypothetical protein